jgi:plastocyanin
MTIKTIRCVCCLSTAIAFSVVVAPRGWSQNVDVTAHVEVSHQDVHAHAAHISNGDVVVWLTPLQKDATPPAPRKPQEYTLAQKDKQFTPHMLVVPTGSSINFPNLDPFFHNVFSMFNGKRFDLGLYEAHTRKTVRFDREGVSYIFCNIHPQMGAVVVALSTPYYAVSTPDGNVMLHDIPSGSYRLNVWAENMPIDGLNQLGRVVEVTAQSNQLGTISLHMSGDIMSHHANKFGESYPRSADGPY